MVRNKTVGLVADEWTELTADNVAEITFQNVGGSRMLIKGTAGAVAPTDLDGALAYAVGQGERNVALADLFPGVVGANRVFAYVKAAGAAVVSHA